MTTLLNIIAAAVLAIVAVFFIYCLALTVIYVVKFTVKELKGGQENGRNNKP